METLKIFVAYALMLYLISLLYVLPTYFRRLDQLIGHLRSNHEGIYSELGAPSLSFLDSTIRGTYSIAMFVVRKDYLALDDKRITELGNAARWRLLYSLLTVLVPLGAGVASTLGNV